MKPARYITVRAIGWSLALGSLLTGASAFLEHPAPMAGPGTASRGLPLSYLHGRPATGAGQNSQASLLPLALDLAFWSFPIFGIHCIRVLAAKGDARERRRLGLCPHCGYILRGLPKPRCPECGTGVREERAGSTMTRMRGYLLLLLLLGWLIPIGVGVYARFSYAPKDNADFSILGHMLVAVLAYMCAVGWLVLAIVGALCCLFKAKEKPSLLDYCTNCGYSLRGLPEPRCPECGTGFDPTDAGSRHQ